MTGREQADARNAPPPHQPSDKKQDAMKQPQAGDSSHPQGTRPPQYVIVTWVNAELRDRLQRNNAALIQARQDARRRVHRRKAEPEAEREAEP